MSMNRPEEEWELPEGPPPTPAPELSEEKAGGSRLTVVSRVYYQPEEGEGDGTDYSYEELLDTDEDVYRRRMKVTPEWQRIDHGWLEECSALVLEPIAPEEGQQVQIAFSPESEVPYLIVPKGGTTLHPFSLREVFVRVTMGVARCYVTVFPR